METKSKEENEIDSVVKLLPNPGLHPKLNISISFKALKTSSSFQSSNQIRSSKCLISILFKSINPALFFDRFEIENLSLEDKLETLIIPSIKTNHSNQQNQLIKPISWGSRDLESPISFTSSSSSSGLILPLPKFTNLIQNLSKVLIQVEIPLHLRYLNPIKSWKSNLIEINLTSPLIVWTCDQSKPLDYEPIINQTHLIKILAPTGNQTDLIFVQLFTTFVIWFSFLWIVLTAIRSRYQIKIKST